MTTLSQSHNEPPREDSPQQLELEREVIAHDSPEGRPANPAIRGKATVLIYGGLLLGAILAAVVVGVVAGPSAGAAIFGFLILALLATPILWVLPLRARERARAHRKVGENVAAHPETLP
jgi:MFS family permease